VRRVKGRAIGVDTYDVGTWGELVPVLEDPKFWDGKGLKMVNVRMGRMDMARRVKPALKAQWDLLRSGPFTRRMRCCTTFLNVGPSHKVKG
jgi:hypothetical protein